MKEYNLIEPSEALKLEEKFDKLVNQPQWQTDEDYVTNKRHDRAKKDYYFQRARYLYLPLGGQFTYEQTDDVWTARLEVIKDTFEATQSDKNQAREAVSRKYLISNHYTDKMMDELGVFLREKFKAKKKGKKWTIKWVNVNGKPIQIWLT